jgi:hypothetical protein
VTEPAKSHVITFVDPCLTSPVETAL